MSASWGLARFIGRPAARIGASQFQKGAQRLVLDCRQSNLRFASPPHAELGGLSAQGDLVLPVGQALRWAEADIKDSVF